MSRIYPPKHGREHRPDGSDPSPDGPKIYVGTAGVDGIDSLLAANPHPYATGDTPGPVPFENSYTADSTGTYEPVWFGKLLGGDIIGGGVPVDGTAGANVYTLPVGYRPPYRVPFSSYDVEGGAVAGGWVEPDGKVYIVDQSPIDSTTIDEALPNTGVSAGSYGDASHVSQITVDTKGRITAAVSTAVAIAESAVTGLVSDLAAKLGLSVFTTKGDLVVATGSGAVSRLGVGTDTFVLTADSGQATGVKWASAAGGSADKLGLSPTAVKTANYTASAGDLVPCDTATTGAFTVTLPTAPSDGSVVAVKHAIQSGTRAVTIATGGSDVFNKASGPTSFTLPYVNQSVILQYKSSSAIWYVLEQEPTSGASAGTYGDGSNVPQVTVDAAGRVTAVSNVSITGSGSVAAADGWTDDSSETWTYVSGSGGGAASFKISGIDLTAKYTPGTRIKLTQTTVKYFVVASSSFSTDTTVNIMAGSDYTLANAAISANYHSYMANPQGYPGWFNWAPTLTGVTSPSIGEAKFSVVGRAVTVLFDLSGTSNSTNFSCDPPITATALALGPIVIKDNGTVSTAAGRVQISSTTLAFAKTLNLASGGWTGSGAKEVLGQLIYPI